MKATLFEAFGTPDVLTVVDLPDRMPGPGEARSASKPRRSIRAM
jgi:NADPH:quinone reductase-like Zn-dependent oxidoreductase